MKKILLLVPLAGCLSSCMIRDSMTALENNRQAVDMSTQTVYENVQAIESANRAIDENRRQIEAVNMSLKKAGGS